MVSKFIQPEQLSNMPTLLVYQLPYADIPVIDVIILMIAALCIWFTATALAQWINEDSDETIYGACHCSYGQVRCVGCNEQDDACRCSYGAVYCAGCVGGDRKNLLACGYRQRRTNRCITGIF